MSEVFPFYKNISISSVENTTIFDITELKYGYSSYSKFLILNDCLIEMQISIIDPKFIEVKNNLVQACYKTSKQISVTMPSNSFAWYINALASTLRGDIITASSSLNKSHITAPNEGWLAQQRIVFIENNISFLAPQVRDIYFADLKLPGFGMEGLDYLVRRYLSEPLMQPVISNAIEGLPPKRQKQFLSLLRKRMNDL